MFSRSLLTLILTYSHLGATTRAMSDPLNIPKLLPSLFLLPPGPPTKFPFLFPIITHPPPTRHPPFPPTETSPTSTSSTLQLSNLSPILVLRPCLQTPSSPRSMLKGQMGVSMLGSKSISLARMGLILSKFLFPRLALLREPELLVSVHSDHFDEMLTSSLRRNCSYY
jgi:hypothetical protein